MKKYPLSKKVYSFRPDLVHLEERAVPAFGFGWAFGMGSPGDFENGNDLAVDGLGDVYVSGYFSGTTDFDPGPGTAFLTPSGTSPNDYVAKYTPGGAFVWVTDLGPRSDVGARVAVQGADAYVAYVGQAGDTNVARLDPATGTPEWTTTLAGGGGSRADVAVGPTGDVYATGTDEAGQVFVSRLDDTGAVLWTTTTGGAGATARGVAVDAAGNAHVVGDFAGTVTFGTTALTATANSDPLYDDDAFLWKVTAAGAPVWAGRMGSNGAELGAAVAVDAGGNVVVAGSWGDGGTSTSKNNDFDPGSGTVRLSHAGNSDIFIARLTPNANGSLRLAWAKSIGGPRLDSGIGLATDASGNIYTTGSFSGPVDFDPGSKKYTLQGHYTNSIENFDVYVSTLTSAGAFAAAAEFVGNSNSTGRGIAVDVSGNAYVTGMFRKTVDFDPTAGTYNLTVNDDPTAPFGDAFVVKLTQSGLSATTFLVVQTTQAGYEVSQSAVATPPARALAGRRGGVTVETPPPNQPPTRDMPPVGSTLGTQGRRVAFDFAIAPSDEFNLAFVG